MKCIYCNDENNITVSDIIPFALTGAKVKCPFVCKTHNAFTNDNYEKAMIKNMSFFRSFLGLRERDGDPVRFTADIDFDGYQIKNQVITDKASVVSGNRIFSTIDDSGKKVIIGPTKKLLKISGATEVNIETLDLRNVAISSKSDIRTLFISNVSLHVIAKIAYEWYCLLTR